MNTEQNEKPEKLNLVVSIVELDENRKEVSIEIPVEEVTSRVREAYEEIRKGVQIPGFRPGKIPQSILRARFGKIVNQEVAKALFTQGLQQAHEEHNLRIVGEPTVEQNEFKPDQAFSFKITFDSAPEVTLGQYKGLTITRPAIAVADEDVTRELTRMQEKQAVKKSVTDRPVQTSDYVLIELSGVSVPDGETVYETMQLEIDGIPSGTHFAHTDFEQQILGMSLNEPKTFELSFPEDYANAMVAGKTVNFTVLVLDIKTKELPELNDEFAQDYADIETIDKLRELIRAQLAEVTRYQREERLVHELVITAVQNAQFTPPEKMINRQIAAMMNTDDETKIAELKEQLQPLATLNLQKQFVLQKIAEVENLELSEEELDAEIERLAESNKTTPEKLRAALAEQDRLSAIESRLLDTKVQILIYKNAVITNEDPNESAHEHDELLPELDDSDEDFGADDTFNEDSADDDDDAIEAEFEADDAESADDAQDDD